MLTVKRFLPVSPPVVSCLVPKPCMQLFVDMATGQNRLGLSIFEVKRSSLPGNSTEATFPTLSHCINYFFKKMTMNAGCSFRVH